MARDPDHAEDSASSGLAARARLACSGSVAYTHGHDCGHPGWQAPSGCYVSDSVRVGATDKHTAIQRQNAGTGLSGDRQIPNNAGTLTVSLETRGAWCLPCTWSDGHNLNLAQRLTTRNGGS